MIQRMIDLWWGYRYFRLVKGQDLRASFRAARRLAGDETADMVDHLRSTRK